MILVLAVIGGIYILGDIWADYCDSKTNKWQCGVRIKKKRRG